MNTKIYSSIEPHKLAFLGLGVMGYPMAGHLVRAGHQLTVYNRTTRKADQWVTEYESAGHPRSQRQTSPKAAVQGASIVFACVGNDDDLRSITLGKDGAFAGMQPGSIFVDHTTASAGVARELAALAVDRGLQFIDAPVSGGQAGAVNGVLTVMCGGEPQAFERIKTVSDAYARAVTLLGASGSGQLAKMVNQICIAGLLQGLAEGVNFGLSAGLDMKQVLAVLSKGAAQSWQMEQRGNTMVDDKFDFGFAVDWMRKDLGLCLDEARHNGAPLPITALVDQFYGDVQKMGGNRLDTSSLLKRLRSSK
jgi:3-hydroxyisobutyrate dehydrogenase